MSQNTKKNKHATDNPQAEILPTDRADFLNAIAMDHDISAKESMAVRVASIILKHRHNETGTIVLKRQTIAVEIGCSPSAVDKAVAVLKRQGWYEVGHVYAKRKNGADTKPEIIANWYDPRWDKAAAVGGVWSIETRRLCQNEEASPPERGDLSPRTSKQNSGSLSHGLQPIVLSSGFPTHSGERVKPTAGPSGIPAGDDALSQFIAEMHKILPEHEPYDGHENRKSFNAERSRQGELPNLRKLILKGWTQDEVQEMIEAYVQSARDDESCAGNTYKQTYKTLSAIFIQLLDKTNDQGGYEGDEEFYGRRLPDRFLPNAPANDDQKLALASG